MPTGVRLAAALAVGVPANDVADVVDAEVVGDSSAVGVPSGVGVFVAAIDSWDALEVASVPSCAW